MFEIWLRLTICVISGSFLTVLMCCAILVVVGGYELYALLYYGIQGDLVRLTMIGILFLGAVPAFVLGFVSAWISTKAGNRVDKVA